jgi:putative hydrolase of the HAD superfamily
LKHLKAIFFDVDDTFYSTSEFSKAARVNAVKAMIDAGLTMTTTECLRELNEVIQEFSSNYDHHFDRLLQRVSPDKYQGVNTAVIVAAGVVAYHDTKFRQLEAYRDVLEVLAILHRAANRPLLGVITAGLAIKQAEKLVRLKVLEYLDPQAIFVTDQLGISKPNRKLYLTACQRVGVKPREAMYVGDHPGNDVDPVNSLGMISVLNRRGGKYVGAKGKTEPSHVISDFWDLLDILQKSYHVAV